MQIIVKKMKKWYNIELGDNNMNQETISEIFSVNNIFIYLLVVNFLLFLLMWYDKHEAKVGQWRISEKALFGFALIGGSLGGIMGMHIFHHKTKKWYFKYGFPIILVLQIIILIMLLTK